MSGSRTLKLPSRNAPCISDRINEGTQRTVIGIETRPKGFESRQAQENYCPPVCPDRLWAPINLLFIGYHVSFLSGKAAGA
jgi:hypothetical protein